MGRRETEKKKEKEERAGGEREREKERRQVSSPSALLPLSCLLLPLFFVVLASNKMAGGGEGRGKPIKGKVGRKRESVSPPSV